MDVDPQQPIEAIPSTPASAPATPMTGGDGGGDNRRGGKGPDRRKSGVDRRSGLERRQKTAAESGYTGAERRSGDDRREDTGLERRRGPGRRRSDDRRSAEEGEMTGHQFEFVMAIETYKKVNKRMYPTWTEILEILRQLGYRKVMSRTISLNAPEPTLLKLDANGDEIDEE
jgi:hypothetical protein